jgi:hypothetical protein
MLYLVLYSQRDDPTSERTLYSLQLSCPRLVALAAIFTLAQGCVLSDDFGELEDQQLTPDSGQDAGDTGGTGDIDGGVGYLPITPKIQQCAAPATIFEVDQGDFGSASGAFFGQEHATVYDIGQASADAFAEIWRGHAIAVASTTSNNELAVGWGSVGLDHLPSASESDSTVIDAPLLYAGGEVITLADGASADPLVVHDVELMLPRQGAALGRYQIYNILVFTNAGTYGCRVSRTRDDGDMVDPQVNCSHAWALDLVLNNNDLSPVTSFEWLPVKETDRREIVGVATGGTLQKRALVHYDPDDGIFGKFSVVEADNTIQWTGETGAIFTGELIAWGWPAYANDYPLVYMLDHAGEARAVELAYRDGGATSSGYFESPQAPQLPLAPAVALEEGKFAFAYRLFGSAMAGTESHTAGFVGLDDAGRGVILGLDEPIGGSNWQIYETSDITELWSFPNGGPTLLAFARGGSGSHLELASWDLGTELRTIGGAITSNAHDVSGIDDVRVHSTWYYSDTPVGETPYRGLLSFAAESDSQRALYLLAVDDVRDVHSICPSVN